MSSDVAVRPGKLGRSSKRTPEVMQTIIDLLRDGNYMSVAAAQAGIHEATFYRWLDEAEHNDAPDDLREFREAVLRARAEAETKVVRTIGGAIRGGAVIEETTITRTAEDGTTVTETAQKRTAPDGRLGLEFLARSHPERWGRVNRLEHTGAGGGPIEVSPAQVEQLAARVQQHRRAIEGDLPVLDAEVIEERNET